jgi:hypothetical protein
MPDWTVPVGALVVLLVFLYFAFIRTKRAHPSETTPTTRTHPIKAVLVSFNVLFSWRPLLIWPLVLLD